MTARLLDAKSEPADKTAWITADHLIAVVRADAAKRSNGADRWYGLTRIGPSEPWSPSVAGPDSWSNMGGPEAHRESWPLAEGPSDLYDLVIREVGSR